MITMGKDHVTAPLDALLALDTDGIPVLPAGGVPMSRPVGLRPNHTGNPLPENV
jgi:hypothetical protein